MARIKAESGAYITTVLVHAFCKPLKPHMTFNRDATQFIVVLNDDTVRVFISTKETGDKPLADESGGNLDTFIKLYDLHNVAGYDVNAVFLIADESIEERDSLSA